MTFKTYLNVGIKFGIFAGLIIFLFTWLQVGVASDRWIPQSALTCILGYQYGAIYRLNKEIKVLKGDETR